MEIYINDQIFYLENASSEGLIKLIESETEKQNKLISHYIVDGNEYYDLKDIINKIHSGKVEIILKTEKELVLETFTSIHQYLDRALPEIHSLTDEFYSDVSSSTWNKVTDLLEGLDWIFQAIQSASSVNAQGIDMNGFQSLLQKLQVQFPELEQAFIDQDTLAIADVIQYEIKPVLEELKKDIQMVLRTEDEGHVI